LRERERESYLSHHFQKRKIGNPFWKIRELRRRRRREISSRKKGEEEELFVVRAFETFGDF
tara:strand:- start:528 stop:710 length:183 start_codon:yes stop_codon:yes gene_type:complete